MAILGASFQIGRSALAAYQAAIAITGQNIANVGNPDYSRQTGHLAALHGGMATGGVSPGAGINLDRMQRHVDEAVEARLRLALGARSGAETTYQTLSQVEALYNELTDYDLSSQLSELFGRFTNLQTDPAELSSRSMVLAGADVVVRTLQRQRSGLLDQISDLNAVVETMITSANALAAGIAELNERIVTVEAGNAGAAGALRDRRDGLLRQLGELVDIRTREQDTGIVNVYLGSDPLVDFGRSRGLTSELVNEDGVERVAVRFADDNATVVASGGRLGAAIATRDTHLVGQLDQLDQLALALIYEVNRVHSTGQGLVGYESIVGTYTAADPDAALNTAAARLTYPIQNGTFLIQVRDQVSGRITTRMIEVDLDGLGGTDTTLTSLAAALDGVARVSASVTGDNRLRLTADDGFEITFAEDSSGALAALGIATFFDGINATTMAVNAAVRAEPRLIATSLSGAPGDGDNAGRLAAVGSQASALLGQVSIRAFHESILSGLATDTAAARNSFESADAIYSSLRAQREATSGVSLDEEAINLTKYARSFQGASRFISVLDSLSDEVLALVS